MNYIAIDKSYIENRIAELKRLKLGTYELEDMLAHSIEIPVEESWREAIPTSILWDDDLELIDDHYPNGVVIKPN